MSVMNAELLLPDSDSERSVIGSILLKPSLIDECHELSGLEFVDAELGATFDVLRKLRDVGFLNDATSPAEILTALQFYGAPESIANPTECKRLMGDSVGGVYAKFYAGKVKRAATLRRHVEIIADWQRAISETATDPRDIAKRVEAELAALGATATSPVRSFADIGRDVIQRLTEGLDKPSCEAMVGSGLPSVDGLVGGLHGGELIVLAARPGQGKTALALQAALHNARRGRRVLVVSLEMQDRELIQRVLCGESGVNGRLIRTHTYERADVDDMQAALGQDEGTPLFVCDPPRAKIEDIRAIARVEHSRAPLGLLVVDYLQLISASDPKRQRYEAIGHQSASLKALAKELGVPILCLAQLGRELDKQERDPRLSDLRESGNIEADADMVLALQIGESGGATLFVLKQRHGETGKLNLRWNGAATRFEEDGPEPCEELQQWSEGWEQSDSPELQR